NFVGEPIFRLKEPKESFSLDLLKANLTLPLMQKPTIKEDDTILQNLHKAVYLFLIKDTSAFDIIILAIDKGLGN